MTRKKTAPFKGRTPLQKPSERALLIWGVPKGLRDEFSRRCRDNGTNMKRVITDFMKQYAH